MAMFTNIHELNQDALADLYECCLVALGAYGALKALGADKELLGYKKCLVELKAAIKKAQENK